MIWNDQTTINFWNEKWINIFSFNSSLWKKRSILLGIANKLKSLYERPLLNLKSFNEIFNSIKMAWNDTKKNKRL